MAVTEGRAPLEAVGAMGLKAALVYWEVAKAAMGATVGLRSDGQLHGVALP
jgi:hypothetical protein